MTDPYAMDTWYRSLIVLQLDRTIARLKAGSPTKMQWLGVKATMLSIVNDIDRCLDYGHPGAGLDALLGSKDQEHIANCPYKNCRRCEHAKDCPAYGSKEEECTNV